jgi:hypothetical protein
MSHKTAATVAQTIGIDTGKNTLHSQTLHARAGYRCARPTPSIFSHSASTEVTAPKSDFRSTPRSGHCALDQPCPKGADFVAKVG